MIIEIPDDVVENWREILPDMISMYQDSSRSDWFDADDIAREVAEGLAEYILDN